LDHKGTNCKYRQGEADCKLDGDRFEQVEADEMMVSDKLLKAKAQEAIRSALEAYRGGGTGLYESPPKETVAYGNYDKLNRHQIDQGVVALVLHLNLSGGSVADMDLYKLVRTYLWDEDARSKINKVVEEKNLINCPSCSSLC
jgi:hypothetical protein